MLNKRIANKNDYKLVLEIWEKSVKQTHDFLAEADFNFYKAIIPENLDEVKLYLWED
ncbi:TPA: GNAT family N-acetyltransferase, partial [Enterococcus faecium]|nr:GNAT family N-acetyltransferase [Enterococcus faecium]